ncbi:MAG: hypothetical protein E3J72_22485 [Planctomycetota bacterium]|nr:MAG: hypothetical protein E3J72_22485 [Planctomycetota bacterium]
MPEATFEEVIRKLNMLQKDMEYLKDLTQRWLSQEKRFPIIVEGIGKQGERFGEMVNILMDAKVVDLPFPVIVSPEAAKTMSAPGGPEDSGTFPAPSDTGTFQGASEGD